MADKTALEAAREIWETPPQSAREADNLNVMTEIISRHYAPRLEAAEKMAEALNKGWMVWSGDHDPMIVKVESFCAVCGQPSNICSRVKCSHHFRDGDEGLLREIADHIRSANGVNDLLSGLLSLEIRDQRLLRRLCGYRDPGKRESTE